MLKLHSTNIQESNKEVSGICTRFDFLSPENFLINFDVMHEAIKLFRPVKRGHKNFQTHYMGHGITIGTSPTPYKGLNDIPGMYFSVKTIRNKALLINQ